MPLTISMLGFLIAVSAACGGGETNGPALRTTDPGVTAELRESAPDSGRKVEWTVGPRTVFSKDGSASVRIPAGPEGWQVLDDLAPVLRGVDDSNFGDATLLTVASEPPGGRRIPGCRSPFIRRQMPAAGGLVQIDEITLSPDAGQIENESYMPRPGEFRIGKRRNEQCGTTQAFTFRMEGRAFMVWIWVGPDRRSAFPKKPDAGVRRQVVRILNSFQAQMPGAAPLRPPFLAVDCRRPPNTVGCDRVFIHVSTRVPMNSVAVRVGGELGRTFYLKGNRRPDGAKRAVPRIGWTGYMSDAGLTRLGSPLEVKLEPGRTRWVGIPRVRANVEVIGRRPDGPTFVQSFPGTELAAGHG